MAKNYTLAEAMIIAHENGDLEALADLGRRYPLLMAKVQRLVAKAGEEAIDLAQYFPEYLSANKVNKAIKDGTITTGSADEDAEDDEDDTEDETPKSKKATAGGKPAKSKKGEDDDEDDGDESKYASMSSRDLWNLLGKLNARKACEKEFGDLKKGSMVKYLEKYGEGTPDADEPDEDDEESTDEYTGKTAIELFKLCKQRKVKAEPKKPAKYYIDLLKKDDAAKTADAEDEDDEEWDDDEEEETPAPKAKSTKGKTEKAAKAEKPAKGGKKSKPAEEDDEDDEWEI